MGIASQSPALVSLLLIERLPVEITPVRAAHLDLSIQSVSNTSVSIGVASQSPALVSLLLRDRLPMETTPVQVAPLDLSIRSASNASVSIGVAPQSPALVSRHLKRRLPVIISPPHTYSILRGARGSKSLGINKVVITSLNNSYSFPARSEFPLYPENP